MSTCRTFAVVPAAGHSRRMGTSKLLLDVGGRPLIDVVMQSWCNSAVDVTVVVVRAGDENLIERCRRFPAVVVPTAIDPPEMRDSLVIGLDHLERLARPLATDAWMTAPADLPGLTAATIDAVLARYDPANARVVAAAVAGRRRHPVLLPWREASAFRSDSTGGGLDDFLSRRSSQIDLVPLGDHVSSDDLDTPADLIRWTPRH